MIASAHLTPEPAGSQTGAHVIERAEDVDDVLMTSISFRDEREDKTRVEEDHTSDRPSR
jgi:hypothetical protein